MLFSRKSLLLYAVTNRRQTDMQTFLTQIEDALAGGVTCIQLREKNIEKEDFIKEAAEVKKLCHAFGAPLIINDSAEVALRSGADGVHVGIDDAPVSKIRKIAGKNFIIGATAKTVEQAVFAENSGADYLGVGAVFPSPTKTNAVRVTKEQLRSICSSVSIPAVAIGGITLENINEIANCNISGIAAVSAIFAAEDVKSAAVRLKEAVINILT